MQLRYAAEYIDVQRATCQMVRPVSPRPPCDRVGAGTDTQLKVSGSYHTAQARSIKASFPCASRNGYADASSIDADYITARCE